MDPDRFNGPAPDDVLTQWSALIDRWEQACESADGDCFRWSETMDCEVAEYLLHGLERCLHSSAVQALVTPHEAATHWPFTRHLILAFVDSLSAEGDAHEHYVDQILTLFGASLD